MGIGGLLAIVVLLEFGKGPDTDGFFAAYGSYAVLLTVAQSLRASVVARLVERGTLHENLDRFLGAAALVFLASGVVLVGLGRPLADVLTGNLGNEARDAAQTALAILWLAAGAQLVAALAAATLAVRGQFALPGLAYVLGGLTSIAFVLALSGAMGVDAVSVGVAIGSALTAAAMLLQLMRAGYRPSRALVRRHGVAGAIWVIASGSIGSLSLQFGYVISLAFAARVGAGSVTLYTYAFFAAALLIGAIATPSGIVLAAPVASTWDRRPATLEPHMLAVFRVGLTFAAPLIAAAAVAGTEVVDLVLGSSLTHSDAVTLIGTFMGLSGLIVAMIAVPLPLLAAFSRSRYLAVAVVSLVTVGIQVALCELALQLDWLEAIAIAASISSIVFLGFLLGLLYEGWPGRALLTHAREVVLIAMPAALAFGPAALAGLAAGGAWRLLWAALAAGAYVVMVRALLPEHWALVQRVVAPIAEWRRAPARAA
jgi:peptidoglycan biosynthesis protein MviN/MurJ (putative lipid II flippase)